MTNLKLYLYSILLLLISSALAFYFESNYEHGVRILYEKLSNHKILFLDHSNYSPLTRGSFILSFGLFISLTYYLLIHQTLKQKIINVVLAGILFILSTIAYCYFNGLFKQIECTACDDGIRVLKYSDINYDFIFVSSLLTALLPTVLTAIKIKNPLIYLPLNFKKTKYLGIFLGALYGIALRVLGGIDLFGDFYSIYSISFIWITPILIGLIPIFFSSNELYKSKSELFFYPIISIIIFGMMALSTGIEDILCLLILGFPFLLTAGLTGLIIGSIIKNAKVDKKIYSILLLPLLLNPIEHLFPNVTDNYTIESKIIINENAKVIWNNIIEVPEIKEEEYEQGFFNYIGVPRPIKSTLEKHDNKVYRVGYFTDNLKLYETISEIEENKFVNFKIDIDKSELRNTASDQHLLRSNYFFFENISYTLKPINENQTELILSCDYTIESKMNGYANFWASNIIKDFEVPLLNALKYKMEIINQKK